MDDSERETIQYLIEMATSRELRERVDPLLILDENRIRQRFRLTRNGFHSLLALIQDDLASRTLRTRSLTSAHKLGIFLEHVGSASLERTTALTLGCSQSTISRVIAEVSDLFYRRRKEFIKWPQEDEQRVMQTRFFELCGIPHIIGALDGSHVRIIAPSISEDSYVNRKDYHSINMAAVCNLDQRFLWGFFKVFRSSDLYRSFQTGRKTGKLLADSAYRSEKFPLKLILREYRTAVEARYTDAVCRGRVIIENAFGSLKRQFQALHTELSLLSSRLLYRDAGADEKSIPPQYPDAGNEESQLPDVTDGDSIRRYIVENYFT
ncbi:unnamed protein product [Cylicocyclus nassatus]|uniref:Putative nuclease HARBI1 n=1 Tax=Cylicocyclus nassatus TaxID=53992 RepID=A0AA36DNL9_CYLNA|nr:unnamed protein product [Cylicocyclus nassatus]